MYSQYNLLQSTKLHEQQYMDTQMVKLGIYSPNRDSLLKASLECQLHGNYYVSTSIAEIMETDCEGVLIVEEDAELMSIALMNYANAIAEGADFVYSDEVYGANLETTCFRSEPLDCKCTHVAMVSKKLFLKVIEKTNDIHRMICVAAQLATNVNYIPSALVSYRRPIVASDLFSENKKRALVLCHEFSMTGAPIVLVSAMPILKSKGYEVVVVGPEYDGATQLFLETGVTVIVNEQRMHDDSVYGIALHSDFVLANTVVEADSVGMLSGSSVPVLWWLHDAFLGYPFIEHRLPKRQADNVKICAVGKHATAAMHSVRSDFEIEQLIYGLPDYAKDDFEWHDFKVEKEKVFFAIVGSFETRKGQDILAEAISMLSPEEVAKTVFLFVGNVLEQSVFLEVEKLVEKYPENVQYIRRLTRDEIKSLMSQCSGVICSSTDDPMPTFVTEAAMFGKPGIVSEHTGTAGLITPGKNGFIYHNDDPVELCQMIREVIKNSEQLEKMHAECRLFYEQNFTKEVFEKTLVKYMEDIVNNR